MTAPIKCEYALTVWLFKYDKLAMEAHTEPEVGLF